MLHADLLMLLPLCVQLGVCACLLVVGSCENLLVWAHGARLFRHAHTVRHCTWLDAHSAKVM